MLLLSDLSLGNPPGILSWVTPDNELYRITGLAPPKSCNDRAVRCVCLTEEHHGDLRHADDDPCVRGCLDNFAGTGRVSIGWRNVKRVESRLELAERCADVVYTQAEETLSPYVTDNRLADWKDVEVCES